MPPNLEIAEYPDRIARDVTILCVFPVSALMEAKDFSTGNEKLRIKLGEYDSFEARVQPIVFLFVRLSSN
jgi:hypothetical protein